jgi:hypothetical protein
MNKLFKFVGRRWKALLCVCGSIFQKIERVLGVFSRMAKRENVSCQCPL